MTSYKLNLEDAFNREVAGQSLVHLINLVCGNDAVGAEVGLFKAETFCLLLQNCPGIKKLYGIDSWQPWKNQLTYPDFECDTVINEKENAYVKMVANYNIQYQSGCPEKVVILEEDHSTAVHKIADNELDFLFLDAYNTYEQASKLIREWYPKVKPGGLFAGYDWYTEEVQRAVKEFIQEQQISSTISFYDSVYVWIKH